MPKISVTARKDGFRRAGRSWPAGGTTVDTAEFNTTQLKALKAERELVVVEIPNAEGDDEGPDKSPKGAAKRPEAKGRSTGPKGAGAGKTEPETQGA